MLNNGDSDKIKVMSSWDWINIAKAYFLEIANNPYTSRSVCDRFKTAAIELRYAEEANDLIRAVNIVAHTYTDRVES